MHPEDDVAESVTRLDPRRLADECQDGDLFVAACVPDVQKRIYYDEDTGSGEATFWILENSGHHGSWASVDYEPGRNELGQPGKVGDLV